MTSADFWEPRQGVEVHGELKALGISCLGQEPLGLGRIVPVELLETFVPVRVPDPWPDGTVQLGMIPMYAHGLHPVRSKNSCSFTCVVFQEPSEPLTTLNGTCTFCVLADWRKEEHIALALMIALVMKMLHVLCQCMPE